MGVASGLGGGNQTTDEESAGDGVAGAFAGGTGGQKVPVKVRRKNESAIRCAGTYEDSRRQQMQSELSEPVQFVSTIKTPFL